MKEFAQGIYFYESDKDFILGKLSVNANQFITWLQEQQPDEKGYVKLDILRSKEGKPYIALNDWKPQR